ncbi:hypothetical protein F7725_006731 [Dissostichus mawsoni]|uniref:NADP-dependent oxidoreductase domain-containing protein n=1 Tax=Dissostichus mawsoni TaxID=36200 RepID=A0A7J5XWI5_DISMA|nr:hypothetical protein F7725_006731 [Dissostichus mawsoni]
MGESAQRSRASAKPTSLSAVHAPVEPGEVRPSCFLPRMAENLMTMAYENGVNLFDTAEVYASGRSGFTPSSKHRF